MRPFFRFVFTICASVLAVVEVSSAVAPVGTAFTYQAQLGQGGLPVNETCDFVFTLWDDPVLDLAANQVGPTVPLNSVSVSNGLFTAKLDFGNVFDGNARWLQVEVRSPAWDGQGIEPAFTTLSPRQELTPGPYTLFATKGGVGPGFWSADGDDIYNNNAGNVGIGITDPPQKLTVRDGSILVWDARPRVHFSFTSGSSGGATIEAVPEGTFGSELTFWTTTPGTGVALERMRIDALGNVGIGMSDPGFQLHLSQDSAAKPVSNTWTIVSDARLKKNVRTIDNALKDLLSLRGVTYQWIDPETQGGLDGTYTGLIAQEVEQVFPEWIGEGSDGYKHLTVIGFEGIIVEALRELREEKDRQLRIAKLQIERLERQVAGIQGRLARLEDLLRANKEDTR